MTTATIILLFLVTSLTYTQSGRKGRRRSTSITDDIYDLKTNSEVLASIIKSAKSSYGKICQCENDQFTFHLIKTISNSRTFVDIQEALYQFIPLLREMTKEERNPNLKKELYKIAANLNDTYNTVVNIMLKKKLKIRTPAIKSVVTLDKLVNQYMYTKHIKGNHKVNHKAFRNYFTLDEFERVILNIAFKLGQLSQAASPNPVN